MKNNLIVSRITTDEGLHLYMLHENGNLSRPIRILDDLELTTLIDSIEEAYPEYFEDKT